MQVGPIAARPKLAATLLAATLLATLGASAALLTPTEAHAQRRSRSRAGAPASHEAEAPEVTRARELFREGVGLVGEHQLEAAEARFREALTLHEAPAIHFNLASVLFEQRRYPEAEAENARALGAAELPEAVRQAAEELRAAIASHAGQLRISRVGDAEGASVAIDGYTLEAPELEVPVAPGAHVVTASLDERELARRDVEIVAGTRRTIELGTIAAALPPAEPLDASVDQEVWFWPVVAGGAALVVAIGVGIGVAAASGPEGPVEGNFMPGVIRWP